MFEFIVIVAICVGIYALTDDKKAKAKKTGKEWLRDAARWVAENLEKGENTEQPVQAPTMAVEPQTVRKAAKVFKPEIKAAQAKPVQPVQLSVDETEDTMGQYCPAPDDASGIGSFDHEDTLDRTSSNKGKKG